jgi:hypothetical protein
LQNVLDIIFPVLQERNPYLKIQFEPASGQLIELAIGDKDDVSGITWFRLFWDYEKPWSPKIADFTISHLG